MNTTGLGYNLGGTVSVKRFTIGSADCTAAATTQTIALFTLPVESVVIGVRIKGRTAFAGTAISAVTVSVGSASLGATGLAGAFDIFQAVVAGTFQMSSVFKQGPDAAEALNAYMTAVGGNLSAMTAGKVTIDIFYFNQTTPVTAGQ